MTAPIREDDLFRTVGQEAFKTDQLQRRPVAGGGRFEWKVMAITQTVTTGDEKDILFVPEDLDGKRLTEVALCVSTESSSGKPTVQLRNIDNGDADMLSTKVEIDSGEVSSYTAATQPVIDTANAVVHAGDRIACDVDVAGTGAKGLTVILAIGTRE